METGNNGLTLILTIVTSVSTALYTICSIFLWLSTKRSTDLIKKQIEQQVRLNHSISTHQTINRHKDIFFEIMKTPDLLSIFSSTSGQKTEHIKGKILASILINHAHSMFIDYNDNIANKESFESFEKDLADLITLPFIKLRWLEVQNFHPTNFKDFVNKILATSPSSQPEANKHS